MRVIRIVFVVAVVFFAFHNPEPAVTQIDRTAPLTAGEQVFATALAQDATVRIVASTCGGAIKGSGFAVDGRLLTNKHLTFETDEIKVDRLGTPVLRPVLARSVTHDVAMTDAVGVRELILAAQPPISGEPVVLAGHAGGGVLQILTGSIQAEVDGSAYGIEGQVLLIAARTTGGFSGGPVVNRTGEVVGMLQGFDYATGLTLAIPAKTLSEWGDSGSNHPGNIGAGICG